jgi:hypothetical protein
MSIPLLFYLLHLPISFVFVSCNRMQPEVAINIGKAEALKNDGNEAFKQNNLLQALKCYHFVCYPLHTLLCCTTQLLN